VNRFLFTVKTIFAVNRILFTVKKIFTVNRILFTIETIYCEQNSVHSKDNLLMSLNEYL